MALRRYSELLDLDAFDAAAAELLRIRDAHATCTEAPLDCRAGILWATHAALADVTVDPSAARSLLLQHAALVNEMLERRSAGRVGRLVVMGTRLQPVPRSY